MVCTSACLEIGVVVLSIVGVVVVYTFSLGVRSVSSEVFCGIILRTSYKVLRLLSNMTVPFGIGL